ncbi:hypothetical protein L1987_57604 [Smallanthus sonchifolius]|uniref:Uncharacterized protein n=1 Tax=Smallanthus sonchifolius TaxID=185202 RepID=A0ACB9DE26_9ASTR|nr:hypothetical protein L1987_57604 [Smallanthus sonchifolius]
MLAYDSATRSLHGPKAKTNFPSMSPSRWVTAPQSQQVLVGTDMDLVHSGVVRDRHAVVVNNGGGSGGRAEEGVVRMGMRQGLFYSPYDGGDGDENFGDRWMS